MSDLSEFFKNKDILVTGGCGSIGSEIVKRLLEFDVKRVRVFDNRESAQFYLQEELKEYKKLRTLIGDIRDRERLKWAMKGVDIVFHFAALKHVPLCEYNPFEAVATNVYGTQNLIEVARERFILISTDKAVNPINTMGATKLLAEKLVINASLGEIKTLFSCVRFGNVLDSDGSVIPLFKEQIKKGGPVTITSIDMVRFFMTMKEAVNLILTVSKIMKGREIFILKMNAMKIIDLAEVMIEELAPRYKFDPNEIKIIGIRPGEKIYECLMTDEEATNAEEYNNMFILRPRIITPHYTSKFHTSKKINPAFYDGRKAKLLSKNEIRILLKNENIL